MISVVFATKNRAKLLDQVLGSYEKLMPPPEGWRLFVVDNGSNDETPSVLASYQRRLPITIFREARPGKNVALNTALNSDDGPDLDDGGIIAFTDDDAFPWPDRLIELDRAAKTHDEMSIFGGTIVPRWEVPPPDWVLRSVPKGSVFALTEPSIHREGPSSPSLIWGPNMSVRAQVLRAGFRFDDSLGPNGTSNYTMGDETDFTRRLVTAGYKAWFCEKVVVEHFIRAEQLKPEWILRRAIPVARGEYRLGIEANPVPVRDWFGVPRYLYRELIVNALRIVPSMLGGDKDARFQARWDFNVALGKAIEANHMVRRKTPARL